MSLLRTAARVGVASSVHGRVQRRQRQRWAEQDRAVAPPPTPPPAAPGPASNPAEQLALLKQLGELRDNGILTPAEFDAKKALILGS
jgi:hypothetical protein